MAMIRKNLALAVERLRELAARRKESAPAIVREVIEPALFAEEFVDLLQQLHDAGYVVKRPPASFAVGEAGRPWEYV
jgi:hypothetical protein